MSNTSALARHGASSTVAHRAGRAPVPVALAVIGGVLTLAGVLSRRSTPDPSHPRIRSWYRRLEKPPVTPPDAVFGGIWPLLQGLMSYGAFRLMRAPASPERNTALGLWLATIGLVTAWAEIFFRRRQITGGAIEAGVLVATGAAYVERAARVDKVAAWMGVPITLWSLFGMALTIDIARRNPGMDGRARR